MSITYTVTSSKPENSKTDVLVIPIMSDKKLPASLTSEVSRQVVARMKELRFKAQWGQAELFLAPKEVSASFVALIGLGEPGALLHQHAEGLRRGLGRVMQDARRHGLRSMAIVLEEETFLLTGAAVEVSYVANYRFTSYSKRLVREQSTRSLKEVQFVVERRHQDQVKQAIVDTKKIMGGVELVRNLVNQPASDMSPRRLVEEAKRIAGTSDQLELKVLDRKQAAQQGFNGFLAVAQGSIEEPYVIHLTYRPPTPATRRIVLVGKGITFDSGGLSLKPADYMMDMKVDMAGAAMVLGLFSILPTLRLDVEVHGIIATCENMPSGSAYRPGDVIVAKNGKTIEVWNTDAEGRITLADALSYGVDLKPDVLIDIATLTGACMIAVGETHSGLWSNDPVLQADLQAAAQEAGEGMVAFPLPEEYKPFIQSKVADLRNIGTTRYGDAILAALFLQEFVGETAWAHLDVAGPVHTSAASLPYWTSGATGYGVRTLLNYITAQAGA